MLLGTPNHAKNFVSFAALSALEYSNPFIRIPLTVLSGLLESFSASNSVVNSKVGVEKAP
jgi:hypothetical protein